jgi:hypothetical protein
MMRRVWLCGFGVSVVFTANAVSAAPLTATQAASDSRHGAYVWVDGIFERVNLPRFSLGMFHNVAFAAPSVDLGPVQQFEPRLDAGGVRGAIGTALPGTNARIELGGSYIEGSTGNAFSTPGVPGVAGLLMTGSGVNNAVGCIAITCTVAGALRTDYRAWSLNAKALADWNFGSVIVTPSVAVFGGVTRADQALSQTLELGGGIGTGATYSASTTLQWRDIGGRAGINLRSFVTPSFVIGWGGSVAAAARKTDFSGSDAATTPFPAAFPAGTSTLTLGDSRAALLANAEFNVSWQLTPAIRVAGFAGLNYDHDVPGIAGPSYAGSVVAPTSRSAATLIFDSQTNLYAGGGVTARFGSVRP